MTAKMKSRKFWFTIWAAVTSTGVMGFSIIAEFEASWMTAALALLIGIVTAYVAIGTAKKKEGDK